MRVLRTAAIAQVVPKEPLAPARADFDPITGEKEIVVQVSVTCEY